MNAAQGDTVKVHYTGKLDDGTVFDSSIGREPLEFTLGQQAVIPGFDTAVEGMTVGDKKTVVIGPEDAYGARLDSKIATIERSRLPEGPPPEVGMVFQAPSPTGTMRFAIMEVGEDTVTVDGNHPLAGKQLTFELELTDINRS